MKKLIIFSFLLQIVFSGYSYSQFSNVLFKKYLNLDWYTESRVLALGDQNGDGYDDFLLHGTWTDTLTVYFGGEKIDTSQGLVFSNFNRKLGYKTAIDINHDGFKDILIKDHLNKKILVYYGGSELDTVPDISLSFPDGVSSTLYGAGIINIGDFNGDGYEDVVIRDGYLPNSNIQRTVYYFYSTYPQFDLIPEMIISSDTSKNIKLSRVTYGDLDGDGMSDLMIHKWIGETINENVSISIIRGNSSWDTTSVQSFYQKKQTFDLQTMQILGDINKDNRADVMLYSYGIYYPYYMEFSIIYGSIPVDTVPDVGLNTQNMGHLTYKTMIAGDVNGDTYQDIISIAGNFGYPIVKVFLGGKNMNNHNLPVLVLGGSSNFYGGLIGRVGDVNGDGVDDFLIGTASKTGMSIFGFCEILSGDSSIIVNSIEEESEEVNPEGFNLYDPYPNPFNPEVTVKYTVGRESDVNIILYDLLGKEIVRLLEEENVQKGDYSIILNTERRNLSSGIYFIEFTSVDNGKQIHKKTKKINLIK